MATLIFDREKTEIAEPGVLLLRYAQNMGVRVPSACRGYGTCHECLVEVVRGEEALSPRTERERFLRGDFRLACQARVTRTDVEVEVHQLRRGLPKILSHGVPRPVELKPLTTRCGDTICYRGKPTGESAGPVHGVVLDVGTTTIVINRIDLESGVCLATAAFENPQAFAGRDVVSRIRYANEEGLGELRNVLFSYVNDAIAEMPGDGNDIWEFTVAGNTTMRDIFFGLDPRTIGEKPFCSSTEMAMRAGERSSTAIETEATSVGLKGNPRARIHGLPLIGSHVGADTSACLAALRMWEENRLVLLVDIGTNSEVVLGNRNRAIATSCAAGPAFEGAGLVYGMPGFEGAIETVRIRDKGPEYRTIGGRPPRGICGSGWIDLLAELFRHGLVNRMGRLRNGHTEYILAPEEGITVFEKDLSILAQAKGATYAGIRLLLETYGAKTSDIEALYLAGGFANYINVESAKAIGLIPNIPTEKIHKIGNAAAEGAADVLLNREVRSALEAFVETVEHIELERLPGFYDAFVEGCMLGPLE